MTRIPPTSPPAASRRARRAALSLLCVTALVAVGCTDRRQPRRVITYNPPDDGDMGVGADGAVPSDGSVGGDLRDDPQGPPCSGEGTRCALDFAEGVCVAGRCQLLTCIFGWRDCDGMPGNGCETAIDADDSCGACGVSCEAPSRCQEGPRGYECSASVVCPESRYDLDGAPQNGCEWSSRWGDPLEDLPEGLLVDRATVGGDGTLWLAGIEAAGEAPHVGRLLSYTSDAGGRATVEVIDALEQGARVHALDRIADGGRDLVVGSWSEGLTISLSSDPQNTATLREFCPESVAEAPRAPRGVAPLVEIPPPQGGVAAVATGEDVQWLERGAACPSGSWCTRPAQSFGPADYLRAYHPFMEMPADGVPDERRAAERWRFDTEEMTGCDACLFGPEGLTVARECVGAEQCRGADFDATACGACPSATSNCPSFEPIDVLASGAEGLVYVATRRGVVGLRREAGEWRAGFRLEVPFDPSVAGGAGYLAAASAPAGRGGAGDRIFLLHSDGYLRTLEVLDDGSGGLVAAPAAADLGVSFAAGERPLLGIEALDATTVAIGDGRTARIVRPSGRSARSFVVRAERGDLLGGSAQVRAIAAGAFGGSVGFALVFEAFELHQIRGVRPAGDPSSGM